MELPINRAPGTVSVERILDRLDDVEDPTGKTFTSPTITSPTISLGTWAAPTITDPALTGTFNLQANTPNNLTAASYALDGGSSGRCNVLNKADGQTITLPAASGSGREYTFYGRVTATSNVVIQVASAADYMIGTALLLADAGDTVVGFATANTGTVATETDTVTLTGSAQGGIKGYWLKFVDIASAIWHVQVVSDASGAEASPFSVAV